LSFVHQHHLMPSQSPSSAGSSGASATSIGGNGDSRSQVRRTIGWVVGVSAAVIGNAIALTLLNYARAHRQAARFIESTEELDPERHTTGNYIHMTGFIESPNAWDVEWNGHDISVVAQQRTPGSQQAPTRFDQQPNSNSNSSNSNVYNTSGSTMSRRVIESPQFLVATSIMVRDGSTVLRLPSVVDARYSASSTPGLAIDGLPLIPESLPPIAVVRNPDSPPSNMRALPFSSTATTTANSSPSPSNSDTASRLVIQTAKQDAPSRSAPTSNSNSNNTANTKSANTTSPSNSKQRWNKQVFASDRSRFAVLPSGTNVTVYGRIVKVQQGPVHRVMLLDYSPLCVCFAAGQQKDHAEGHRSSAQSLTFTSVALSAASLLIAYLAAS
jgi:hypothetical protein